MAVPDSTGTLVLAGIHFGRARRLPDPDPLVSMPIWLVEVTLPTGVSSDVIVYSKVLPLEYPREADLVIVWPDPRFKRAAFNRRERGKKALILGIRTAVAMDMWDRDARAGRVR